MITAALFLVFFAIVYYWYKGKYDQKMKSVEQIPGPPELPIIGNSWDFRKTTLIVPKLMECAQKYGGLFKIRNSPFTPTIVFADVSNASFILTNTKQIKKAFSYTFFEGWLGQGLLTGSGVKWRTHRKIITKAFHFKILEDFVEVFNRNSDILVESLRKEVQNTSTNIYNYVSLCALDIICESAMGTSVHVQQHTDSEYLRCVREVTRIAMQRCFSVILRSKFLFSLTKDYLIEKECLKILHDYTDNVIKTRKRECQARSEGVDQNGNGVSYKKKRLAFLDLLLQDSDLSDLELREEVDTFMFAGHDTTAAATSYTLLCLAHNPLCQQKVVEELNEIFRGDRVRSPTYKELEAMRYLEMVIKESLRLYPAVPYFARELLSNVDLDGTVLTKGTTVLVLTYAIHRDPKLYPDPERFIPERFEPTAKRESPYAYIPFSAGLRNCIGQKYALLEMKAVLSKVLRRYELSPSEPAHDMILASEMILKPVNGVHVRLKERRA